MDVVSWILAAVIVCGAGVAGASRLIRRPWLKQVTARKVLVHQTNDATIEGLLFATYPDGLLLRSASLLKSGAEATPMGGEVFIPREKVALVQSDY